MSPLEPHIFESVMLICFGCSWPFAIVKTIRTKTVEGKSIIFITLILIGYVAGIVFKIIGQLDHVVWLYLANASLVFTEMVLYFRYSDSASCFHFRIIRRNWQSRNHFKSIMKSAGMRLTQSIPKGDS